MRRYELDELCRVLHDAYEAAAVQQGWATQQKSRVRWEQLPEANKQTMRSAVLVMLVHMRYVGWEKDNGWTGNPVTHVEGPVSLWREQWWRLKYRMKWGWGQ